MKRFTQLFLQLDQTTKITEKVEALVSYFQQTNDRDKVWAIGMLSHRRPKRTVNTKLLRQWAAEEAQLPLWLLEESYHVVGDLAETLSLVLPTPASEPTPLPDAPRVFVRSLECGLPDETKTEHR
jgi:DNA ligase-1